MIFVFFYNLTSRSADVGSSQNADIIHDLTQDDSNGLEVDSGSSPDIEMLDDVLCDPNKDKDPPQEDLDSSSLVSLSVIGVRFRCPNCDYVDVNLKFVRDHMRDNHKGKKSRELQPQKQEMKVRIKPPRIYKETMLKSIAYYKSFGGQFFSTGIKANVKFVRDPVHYIRNIRDTGKPQDKPCPKRFKKFFRDQREPSVPSSLEISTYF